MCVQGRSSLLHLLFSPHNESALKLVNSQIPSYWIGSSGWIVQRRLRGESLQDLLEVGVLIQVFKAILIYTSQHLLLEVLESGLVLDQEFRSS